MACSNLGSETLLLSEDEYASRDQKERRSRFCENLAEEIIKFHSSMNLQHPQLIVEKPTEGEPESDEELHDALSVSEDSSLAHMMFVHNERNMGKFEEILRLVRREKTDQVYKALACSATMAFGSLPKASLDGFLAELKSLETDDSRRAFYNGFARCYDSKINDSNERFINESREALTAVHNLCDSVTAVGIEIQQSTKSIHQMLEKKSKGVMEFYQKGKKEEIETANKPKAPQIPQFYRSKCFRQTPREAPLMEEETNQKGIRKVETAENLIIKSYQPPPQYPPHQTPPTAIRSRDSSFDRDDWEYDVAKRAFIFNLKLADPKSSR